MSLLLHTSLNVFFSTYNHRRLLEVYAITKVCQRRTLQGINLCEEAPHILPYILMRDRTIEDVESCKLTIEVD